MAGVRFISFLDKSVGLTGRQLGPMSTFTFIMNGVELQFGIDAELRKTHRLKPTQWSGTSSIWIKTGEPLKSTWTLRDRSAGVGLDDPEPQNVRDLGDRIAYWDSPGPNMAIFINMRPSRVFVVQNFTGWIVGQPLRGGSWEKLCDVVAWFSVVDLVDINWDSTGIPNWQRANDNRTGLGWADTTKPPMF